MNKGAEKILVTGATGYIGGRLLPRLHGQGHSIRCLVRDLSRVEASWWPGIDVVQGDVLDAESLRPGLHDISVAYYLVHSMAAGERGFSERDRIAAQNFGQVARASGVKNIIYLGGLATGADHLSRHMSSRQQTGDVLRECGVPVTELQAAVVVGSGSISFEMIRYLTERLPVMIAPRWADTRCQPIAIRDVLQYLLAVLGNRQSWGQTLEIGGSDVLSYAEMIRGYATVRGLRRMIFNVPVLTPRLSSLWVDLITPIPAAFARPLIEGLRTEAVVNDHRAQALFPEIRPVGYEDAVRSALQRVGANSVETVWSGSASSAFDRAPKPVETESSEGLIIERRVEQTSASPDRVFEVASRLGGKSGWLYGNVFWRFRGLLDRLVGGVGMRRGRRHPTELRVGDAVDFWRVERVRRPDCIRFGAEMKLPGRAWLDIQTEETPDGTTRVQISAIFEPKGLAGFIYWYSLYPAHKLLFSGLARNLIRRAELNPSHEGQSVPATNPQDSPVSNRQNPE